MANPSYMFKLEDSTVAFAVLTGDGRKGKKKEKEYVLAVEVSAKQRKKMLKTMTEFWEDNKSRKADAPEHDIGEWFQENKDKKGEFIFWGSEVVSQQIARRAAPGKGFKMQHIADLGSGSVVDAEYNVFYWDNENGEGLGLRLKGVNLKEFVKYTGKSTLEGDELEDSDGLVSMPDEKKAGGADTQATINDFHEAIDDKDWDDAEEALDDLKEHGDYKKFKKELKKAKKTGK